MSNPLLQELEQNPEMLKAFLQDGQRRFGAQLKSQQVNAEVIARVKELRGKLLPQQQAFLKDPSRRKLAMCTRQAGKSYVARQALGEAALAYPGALIPYLGLTRDACKRIMWRELQEWCQLVGIFDQCHFNDQTLEATFPNGSIVFMMGVEKPKELIKLRGPKYPLVVLDESGTFGAHIEQGIDADISPALMRYKGTLMMIGTPGEIAAGIFYEASEGIRDGYSVHKWSFLDNVHLPAEERDLEAIKLKNNWTDATPRYRREYLGEWVPDAGLQVYAYNPELNHYVADGDGQFGLPSGHEWIFGLGIDIGSVDGTAIVIGAFSPTSPNMYLVMEKKIKKEKDGRHLSVSRIAQEIEPLYRKFKFHRPVADSGALAAMVIEELNQRWGFAINPAEKQFKNDFIEHLNSDLMLGRIKIPKESQLAGEMARLVWDDKVTITGKKREKPGLPNDICDAFLYMYRESKHWAGREVATIERPDGMNQQEFEYRRALDKRLEELENEKNDERFWAYS